MIDREKLGDVLRNIIRSELADINDDPFYKTKPERKVSSKTERDLNQIMTKVEEHLKELYPIE